MNYNYQLKTYYPFISPTDPCPQMKVKTYITPPNLYLTFQPPNLPQWSPHLALRHGTLWPALYSPYQSKASFIRKEKSDVETET